MGKAATETRFKRGHPQTAMMHLASHAVVDHLFPQSSAILLGATPEDDGRLTTEEIVTMNLRDTVVVMSSCRSATGRVIGGEGPLGLARGFFHAGAVTVMGSLWPLRDDETATLFEAFYREMGRGRSVGEAMHRAKQIRRRAGAPTAAWAGVVVLGDANRVVVPPRSVSHWALLAVIGIALGLGWRVLRRRAERIDIG